MAAANPLFFKTPLRYLRWASINKPAYFYSIIIGCIGPVHDGGGAAGADLPGRWEEARIPMTYPIPKGERPRPTGFDDE